MKYHNMRDLRTAVNAVRAAKAEPLVVGTTVVKPGDPNYLREQQKANRQAIGQAMLNRTFAVAQQHPVSDANRQADELVKKARQVNSTLKGLVTKGKIKSVAFDRNFDKLQELAKNAERFRLFMASRTPITKQINLPGELVSQWWTRLTTTNDNEV